MNGPTRLAIVVSLILVWSFWFHRIKKAHPPTERKGVHEWDDYLFFVFMGAVATLFSIIIAAGVVAIITWVINGFRYG